MRRRGRALAGPTGMAGRTGTAGFTGMAGFTLVEVMLGLSVLALLAALVLPRPARPVGPAALRTAAYAVSAVLRDARTAAIGGGRPARVVIDGRAGRLAGAGDALDLPAGITLAPLDAGSAAIGFAPDGRATGGGVRLAAAAGRIAVVVNPDTGAIGLAP